MPAEQLISAACADATRAGLPPERHHCTGCPACPCHHVTAPLDFRALVEARKAERTQAQDDPG